MDTAVGGVQAWLVGHCQSILLVKKLIQINSKLRIFNTENILLEVSILDVKNLLNLLHLSQTNFSYFAEGIKIF